MRYLACKLTFNRYPASRVNDLVDPQKKFPTLNTIEPLRTALEKLSEGWDYPIMTVKTDEKRRVVLPRAKPGDVFNVEFSGSKILLTKLVLADSKLVRARKVKGVVMGAAGIKIDSASVVDAIRADREAR